MKFRRKLYTRGSSYETTIPMGILSMLDMDKKHDVLFEFDNVKKKWTVEFVERESEKNEKKNSKKQEKEVIIK